jgi:sodium-dependent dicarboxylate transporter 2/3/5
MAANSGGHSDSGASTIGPADAAALEKAAVRESVPAGPPQGYRRAQLLGLVLGPAVAVALLLLPPPDGLALAGWRTAAIGLWMAIWWMTEAAPIPVTALLPLVLFPLLGVAAMPAAASPYANPLIFLFLGGFLIALAMQRWNLHRRIALNIIRIMGTRPRNLVGGFLVASALLSMWVSNTATALMMLPIGLSVVQLSLGGAGARYTGGSSHFAITLMLAIAYGSSIGGMATLIGTPTNAFMVGFLAETYGFQIGFVDWMMVGVPLVLVALPMTHIALTRIVYPIGMTELAGGRELILAELHGLGAMTRAEKTIAAVFACVALLWITQPLFADVVPGITDTGIAMAGALLLFVLPVDFRRGVFVLDWETAEKLPWGVLLLFGGGLSLAGAVAATGLADWIGAALAGVGALPPVVIVLIVTTIVVFLTELTSNTATAAAFLPVMASLALGIGENPLLLAVPTVIGASCAFMLPVATPPNAIVYGSSFITIPQMARAGFVLNLMFIGLITGIVYTLAAIVFGIEPGVVPEWALR